MNAAPKRLFAKFFQTLAGNEPARDYLKALSAEDRRIVGSDIATVEYGWPVGMPTCRPVGTKGLREVRSTIRNGRVESRTIFGIDGDLMILLHSHDKKPSQQQNDIAIAEARWAQYLTEKE